MKETIAAIATALSDSGIGIIRISGPEAVAIADKIFYNKYGKRMLTKKATHTIHYGFIVDNRTLTDSDNWESAVVDEVMVMLMKAPHSYTTEDTVEINCHGGILLMKKILELVIANGARMAMPGEFTKRAFLNGRIDLSKAEAVMDMIHSNNEMALKASVNQLKGSVSNTIRQLREEVLYEIAFIESALDDPEHISLDGYEERLAEITHNILKKVDHLIDTADNGKIIKEGIQTVIIGKPNVGKSSLLNNLLGENRAIVTDIAGTTRDILQESIRLKGISLNIMDTAGIRKTEDVVEKIGVEKAKESAKEADLILYVIDSSRKLDEEDKEILSFVQGKKMIILLNKCDLEAAVLESSLEISDEVKVIKTSATEKIGMEELENTICDMFFQGDLKENEEVMITNLRHKEALLQTKDSLLQVQNSIENHMPEDFYSIDLMSAYSSLGLIIGEEVEDDLVEEIFSKFCMGK